jgi:tetratricopeptide (TPR) repeat protein
MQDNFINKANKLMAKGNFKSATRLLDAKCRTTPTNFQAHYLLGICLGRQGLWDKANRSLEQSIVLSPNIAQLHFANGIALLELMRLKSAIDSFSRAIELDKELASAYIFLGKTYYILQDYIQSKRHYQQALQISKSEAEAYYGLGCIEHEHGNSEESIAHLKQALNYQPNSVDTLRMLGSLYKKEGIIEESKMYYKKALKINPNSTQASAGLALIYEFEGDIDKANRIIQPLIKRYRHNAALAVAYAKICTHTGNCEDAVIYIKKTLTSSTIINDRIRKNLHFTAADVLDKQKQYDSAFEHYKTGNDIANTYSYDGMSYISQIDKIINNFTPDYFSLSPRSDNIDSRPVFIIGMPRSGTSLTEQILAAHPCVYGAGEMDVLDKIAKDMFNNTTNFTDSRSSLPILDSDALNTNAARYLKHIESLSSRAKIITDKMPHNFFHLGIIQLLFPSARIIHITRDPLDNGLSIYLQNFSHGHTYSNDLFNIGTHYYHYLRLMEHWRKVLSLPILEISYEQLVNNQKELTQKLLDFCNLEWCDDCLEFYKQKRNVYTSSYHQVRQPMYKHSIGRWRNYENHISALKKGLLCGY